MSNPTQHSHNQGDNKQRRSRGGQNRRNNNQHNSRGQDRDANGSRDNRGHSQHRNPNVPNQTNNTPLRKYAPVKLTWWQKLLKLIGLYKAPARQGQRPARTPDAPASAADARVKSNTRNARTGDPDTPADERREPDRNRSRNQERGNARNSERSRGGDRDSVESPRVFVGNLSYDVTEGDLQDLFKGIGGVRNVEIVYNRSTHRSKGYAFVEMLHMDEAKRAVEVLHDQPFMGRKMAVSGAKSKGQDEREDNEERDERQERRTRPAPTVASVAAPPAVSAESLGTTTEITTIIEQVLPPEPAAVVMSTPSSLPVSQSVATAATDDIAAIPPTETKPELV